MDGNIERVTTSLREDETQHEGPEGETELSKYIADRESRKDAFVGELEAKRTIALCEKGNQREYMSIMLDIIAVTTSQDIKTLETIDKQLSGVEDEYPELVTLLEQLKVQERDTAELIAKFDENKLAPIASTEGNDETSQSSSRPYQDSSDVYQTDFNPFDDCGCD